MPVAVEVVEGGGTFGELVGVLEALGDEGFGGGDAVGDGLAFGDGGGEGGCEGRAGAGDAADGDAFSGIFPEVCAIEEEVCDDGAFAAPTFDDDVLRASQGDLLDGGADIVPGGGGEAGEEGGFGEVGGDDEGAGDELSKHGFDGGVIGQACAIGGDEDGIDDEALDAVALKRIGDGPDRVGVGQGASDYDVGLHDGEGDIELLGDEGGFEGNRGAIAGEGGDDGGAVDAEGGEGLEVRLNAIDGGGVRGGDREDDAGFGHAAMLGGGPSMIQRNIG